MTPKPQLHERIHAMFKEAGVQTTAASAVAPADGLDAFIVARADPSSELNAYRKLSGKERAEAHFARQQEAATAATAPQPVEKKPALSFEDQYVVDAEFETWKAEQEYNNEVDPYPVVESAVSSLWSLDDPELAADWGDEDDQGWAA